jgi:8-oxo-dGTP pyrophosphatase MutT (NUDIX family)
MSRPVSIKGVCALPDGRVLLCHNHRGDWELPGGRPEPDESAEDCLIRELWEETGLAVRVGRRLGTLEYEVAPERWIDVTGYACSAVPPGDPTSAPRASDEHVGVEFVEVDTLGPEELPAVYRRLIIRAAAAAGTAAAAATATATAAAAAAAARDV